MRTFQGKPWSTTKKASGGVVPRDMAGPYRNASMDTAVAPMLIPTSGSRPRPIQAIPTQRLIAQSGQSGDAAGAVSQVLPALMGLLNQKGKSTTQRKKGGGPVVKGKTQNTKVPQIPKGTPNKTGCKTTPAFSKGGKMKGC